MRWHATRPTPATLALVLTGFLLAPVAAQAALPPGSLLVNGDFAAAAELFGWDQFFSNASWSALDVDGEPQSGSVRIDNEATEPGFSREISQCVATVPGPHLLGAWYLLPSGQSPAGDPGVRWFFHDADGCEGGVIGAGQISTENVTPVLDAWTELASNPGAVVAPAGTRSARLFLVNRREAGAGLFTLFFDDAFLLPEPGAGAGLGAAAAALAALHRRQAARRR